MLVAEMDSGLLADNLAAFGRYMPALFAVLDKHVPQTKLVTNPDGSRDVEFRGQRLYDARNDGTTGPDLARRLAESLRGTTSSRMLIQPMDTKIIDATTNVFVQRLLRQGVEDGVAFLEQPIGDGAYHLIVMGLGLGYHLDELVKLAEPYAICIVEPNLDFLYHSLSTFDWRPILERRSAWPQAVSILTADNAEEIAWRVRMHCRSANPAALDSALVVASYPNDTMERALKLFRRDAHLVHTGLGFFQDELEMTRAAYFNLVRHDDFRVFRRVEERAELPAFVIGSGPSIDDDMEFLKENQDRAAIFCCGSALGVLLANDIRPDFEVLLENGEAPRIMLESINKNYDFEGIRLIASNTISPQIRPLFKDRAFFMRQSLSSYAMFSPGPEYSLEHSGPTVTNTGLEAALSLGFNEIYLFGCDLGARSPERHHSRFSPYRMADRTAEYDASVAFLQSLPDRQLGNFGGVVFTNDIMTWSRDSMELALIRAQGRARVFNCSDGMRINGARAQVSSGVKLEAPAGGKAATVDRLMEQFPPAATFGFADRWKAVDWRLRLHDFAGQLIDICRAMPERSQEALHRMVPLLIPDHRRQPTFEEYCLRGSVFVSIISADYYMRRAHPPEKHDAFGRTAYRGLIELIDLMVEQGDWFFEHLDELTTYGELKESLRTWTETRIPSPST